MYIFTDENNQVTLQVFQPTEEQKKEGIKVDSIPEPKVKKGKTAILYYTEKDGLYYLYGDRPLTQEEEMDNLKRENVEQGQDQTESDLKAMKQGQRLSELELQVMKGGK